MASGFSNGTVYSTMKLIPQKNLVCGTTRFGLSVCGTYKS